MLADCRCAGLPARERTAFATRRNTLHKFLQIVRSGLPHFSCDKSVGPACRAARSPQGEPCVQFTRRCRFHRPGCGNAAKSCPAVRTYINHRRVGYGAVSLRRDEALAHTLCSFDCPASGALMPIAHIGVHSVVGNSECPPYCDSPPYCDCRLSPLLRMPPLGYPLFAMPFILAT